jgi:Outer membrane protein beta-barrel domain
MKKLFPLIIFLALFAGNQYGYAQGNQGLIGGPRHEIGILAGIQFSNFNSSPGVATTWRTSVGGKIFYTYRILGDFISIRGEVGFDSWGGHFRNTDTTIALTYITLPAIALQAKFLFVKAYAGAQLNIITAASLKNGGSYDIRGDYKGTDFAGLFGVEFNLPLRLMIGGRYNFSFTDISDISGADIKNSSWLVYVGFRIHK